MPDLLPGNLGAARAERDREALREFEENRERAEFEAAQQSWDRGDAQGCEEMLARLLARNAGHRDARLLMAEVHLAGGRVQEARQQVEEALRTDPDDPRAQYARGLVLDAAGQPTEALACYERAAAPWAGGDGSDALAGFAEAVSGEPNDPQLPLAAAAAALRHNQPELAIELLQPAEKQLPNSAAIQRTLAVAYYRLGDYASSQVALQQALSLDKSSALAYFLMGCTLTKRGQPESAEAHFRQAQSLDPRYQLRR
jgi:tetratricopeptide (TPR) repeat protein